MMKDWREAELGPADEALCAYAEKLTSAPLRAAKPASDGLKIRGDQ